MRHPIRTVRAGLRRGRPGRPIGGVAAVAALAVIATACASDPVADADPLAYRRDVGAICASSFAGQAALVEPADAAAVTPFALAVAELLESEAEGLRGVRAPAELAADHRALIQNTDDQARRWRALASTSPDDGTEFGAVQTEILQLGLGRDDLAATMGLDACRRASS